jgi:para-aminobenzoate synthetase/4-amino-4-deoxychorismate lyase
MPRPTGAAPPAAPKFELLETLRLTRGSYARRERHLARLAASARHFGFPLRLASAERALDELGGRLPAAMAHRVRLLVAHDGSVRVEHRPLDATDAASRGGLSHIALATSPVSAADPFLYHKTTHRAVYDRHRAEHPGVFDVLLWNESRELTEFTIGNVVVQLGGVQWTPPVECGLLAGTYRAELLDAGILRERRIGIAELERAEALWLVNSLRERVPVILVPNATRPAASS